MFAVFGDMLRPKSFAGLFGAAPLSSDLNAYASFGKPGPAI